MRIRSIPQRLPSIVILVGLSTRESRKDELLRSFYARYPNICDQASSRRTNINEIPDIVRELTSKGCGVILDYVFTPKPHTDLTAFGNAANIFFGTLGGEVYHSSEESPPGSE